MTNTTREQKIAELKERGLRQRAEREGSKSNKTADTISTKQKSPSGLTHETERGLRAEPPEKVVAPSVYDDAIPDASDYATPDPVATSDALVDSFINALDIQTAYTKYGKKDSPKALDKPGEFMARCPNPRHNDENPSAGFNVNTGLWNCFKCGGGDVLSLAGLVHSIDPSGSDLPHLKRTIYTDFNPCELDTYKGYEVVAAPRVVELIEKEEKSDQAEFSKKLAEEMDELFGGDEQLTKQTNKNKQTAKKDKPARSEKPAAKKKFDSIDGDGHSSGSRSSTALVSVTPENSAEIAEEDRLNKREKELLTEINDAELELDFDKVIKPGTFLDAYFSSAKQDVFPNEYHFFNALMVLSLAAGRRVKFADHFKDTTPNLYLCMIGTTGSGKSRTTGYMTSVTKRGLPFDDTDHARNGVLEVIGAASGEAVVQAFSGSIVNNGRTELEGHIKGLIIEDELDSLLKKSMRSGSILKPTILSAFDCRTIANTRADSVRVAKSPYVCMTTSIQPGILSDTLDRHDNASGFLNRFMFVYPNEKEKSAFGNRDMFDARDAFEKLADLKDWLDYGTVPDHEQVVYGSDASQYISFDDAAKAEIERFVNEYFTPLSSRMSRIHRNVKSGDDIFARAQQHMVKIMMLLCVNETKNTVDLDIVYKAEHIMLYFIKTWALLRGDLEHDERDETEEDVLHVMKLYYERCYDNGETPEPLSITKMLKDLNLRKRHSKDAVINAIQRLVKLGSLYEGEPPRRGPKNPRYILNLEAIKEEQDS